jgi:hypothetical protein
MKYFNFAKKKHSDMELWNLISIFFFYKFLYILYRDLFCNV